MKLQPALRVVRLWDSVIPSGNSYKVRLLLAHLGERYALEKVDILRGASRTPEFLARNPAGKVPVAELEDGSFLPESNAILWYLAEGTPYRTYRSGDPVTSDFSLKRLNFEYDRSGKLLRVTCG